jgi:hyperosmotically inducible periplasmic protein
MFKKLSVVVLGAAVGLMTASAVSAQSATQEAKDKTAAAAHKTAEVVTDAEITSAVKTKLLADTTVGGLKIDVDTKNGVVTLSGDVKSAAERTQAVHLARETKGVKKVVSKLTLEPAATATSGKKDIGDKTKDTAEKAAKETEQGAEKAGKATKDAAVKTKDVVADATVTSEVKTKLLADTKVGGLKIDVDTKDNVVTLTGVVNSVEEKNEALRLARTTMGVKRVVDKLTVK